ncbi:DUF6946 family protein [Paludisphaera soli]|uniref:DUF6946 family protein n=1 Tax=Paludisphaera soli TaxID=2712865 RepID=UPI0013EAE360|nr:hypothetical protein [Paludisphaera soli]
MRFHFGNPNVIRTVVDAVPFYGGGEFESPTRSTIPLLSLLIHAPDQFERIVSSLGMPADSDLYLEYTVPPQRGRGNASHTDVMLRSGSKSLAIEAKWTEPLSDTVAKWLDKGEFRPNREAVLQGWLDLLQCRLGGPFDAQDFHGVNYQMLHRAASAAAAGSESRLAYLLFTPSSSKQTARPDVLYRELGSFWGKLGDPESFPFALVEVQIQATPAYTSILDERHNGKPAVSQAAVAALRSTDTPLFNFVVNAPRWAGEA